MSTENGTVTAQDAELLLRVEAGRYHPKGPRRTEMEQAADAIEAQSAEISRLRAALKPFAELASIYVRRAETFGWKDADSAFGAADIEKDVTIRIGDCRAAVKALEET